ncbi:MAG: hypothetical protein INF91_02125 [Alphaproteobacteria bacterium]|nr:hypothetical protein [Alphaproteobacteria bacterium]
MMRAFLLVPVILALAGCTYAGPDSVRATRPAYNLALQQTNDQELLLNLVRIRYRDTTYFTSVERIAATLELNRSIGAQGSLGRTSSAAPKDTVSRGLTIGPGSIALNEKPTVFYAPLEGEKFVRQMMTPMNPDVLFLLVRSGWSIDRVLTIGALEMNGLRNAPTASGPAPSREPEFREFREAVRLLRLLQRDGKLDIVRSKDGAGIDLEFARGSAESPEAQRFRTLTGLTAVRDRYRIVVGTEAPDGATLAITTRPVMAALHFLSTGVEVPEGDVAAGRVRRTVRADGQPFDWQEMLEGLFRVRSSSRPPEGRPTAVRYHDSWFYIADDDLESKSTFVLLTQIIALHSAPPSGSPPITYAIGK